MCLDDNLSFLKNSSHGRVNPESLQDSKPQLLRAFQVHVEVLLLATRGKTGQSGAAALPREAQAVGPDGGKLLLACFSHTHGLAVALD